MGVVDCVRDVRLGRLAAVKILPAEALLESDWKLRFVQEARTASRGCFQSGNQTNLPSRPKGMYMSPRRVRSVQSVSYIALVVCTCLGVAPAEQPVRKPEEWSSYGADSGNSKYSPLDQISKENVNRLRVVWRWRSIDEQVQQRNPNLRPWLFETTPLMIGGRLYMTYIFGQIGALDAGRGKVIWYYDPRSYANGNTPMLPFANRGVAYWCDAKVNPKDERILAATVDNYLLALDARTGRLIPEFGNGGRIDLTVGVARTNERKMYVNSSPPVICRGVVVVGSGILDARGPNEKTPRGDVRGFDVHTGKQLWVFHSVPERGEAGNETWLNASWKTPRGVSAWAPLSADEELGYVYLPFSAPSNDYYGGDRPGNNLFGDSIVCLNARTGQRIWHFQTTHHGLWDYDPPAAPTLVDITVEGRRIKALAQVTKQGFCFVLDRATGKPVWPVIEKAVPQSDAARERTSPTQPFPTKPAPFDRQGVQSEDDLIDFTPELREKASGILKKYNYGPLYTPPSFKGTISVPGSQGGASWAGAAFDPETEMLYVPSVTRPTVMTLYEKGDPRIKGRPQTTDAYSGFREILVGPEGLPLFKPPFGRITAINLRTGDHSWVAASGDGPRNHPMLKDLKLPRLGWPLRTFVLVTKSLLFAAQESPVGPERFVGEHVEADHSIREPELRAYDKRTGELLAQIELPANASGAPMTYFTNGKQYIVVAVGGSNIPAELVALALPET
jgi:quinoprotein glucose dehydrogenase